MGKEEDHGPAPHSYFYQAIQGRFINSIRYPKSGPNNPANLKFIDDTDNFVPDSKMAVNPDYLNETLLEMTEKKNILLEKIQSLPPTQKLIIDLTMQDHSLVEISKKLDMKYSTVKAHYRHGLLTIKKSLFGGKAKMSTAVFRDKKERTQRLPIAEDFHKSRKAFLLNFMALNKRRPRKGVAAEAGLRRDLYRYSVKSHLWFDEKFTEEYLKIATGFE
jgi:DNA-directed RNA polymerase specialized sigma24 family protein